VTNHFYPTSIKVIRLIDCTSSEYSIIVISPALQVWAGACYVTN